jgi:hypothetical protein
LAAFRVSSLTGVVGLFGAVARMNTVLVGAEVVVGSHVDRDGRIRSHHGLYQNKVAIKDDHY